VPTRYFGDSSLRLAWNTSFPAPWATARGRSVPPHGGRRGGTSFGGTCSFGNVRCEARGGPGSLIAGGGGSPLRRWGGGPVAESGGVGVPTTQTLSAAAASQSVVAEARE
jgi:hypothetical protein